MSLFYITGVSGTGKSEVEKHLKKLGYEAYDIDQPRFGGPVNKTTGGSATDPSIEERTPEWFEQHEWRVSRQSVEDLHAQSKHKNIYLCGTASTENLVWDLFDKVFYLNVDENTLKSRILGRNDGYDFGKNEHEMQLILERYKIAQTTISSVDAVIIDATGEIEDVVAAIIKESEI